MKRMSKTMHGAPLIMAMIILSCNSQPSDGERERNGRSADLKETSTTTGAQKQVLKKELENNKAENTPAKSDKETVAKTIIGTWTGYNHGIRDNITFVFKADGSGHSIIQGRTVMEFRYKLDTSRVPIALDIMSGGHKPAYAILEVMSENKIRIKMSMGGTPTRPKAFPAGKDPDTVVFSRE